MIDIKSAIKITGASRSTLLRYIKQGRLSASKDRNNNWSFDPNELARVFGELKKLDETKVTHQEEHINHYAQELIQALREQLQEAKEREKNLIIMLKEEQQSRKNLEIRMLPSATKQGFFKKLFS